VPDLTFAAVGAVVLPSNPLPKRPSLTKTSRNFKLPSFDKLGIALPLPDILSDPCTIDVPGVAPILPNEGFAGGPYLVQPLPKGTINDPSPSLSPDEPGGMTSPSTIQQFIITRTPPGDGVWPSAQDGTPDGQGEAPSQNDTVEEQAAPMATSSSGNEQKVPSESQWMLDVIPQIGRSHDPKLSSPKKDIPQITSCA
jgi:hypothetical protein